MITPPVVFMFSGQGSQYYQMGKDLLKSNKVFRDTMEEGNLIVKNILHRSVIDEIYSSPFTEVFDDLLITHPALIMFEYSIFKMLRSEGIVPDYVWGCSLGEFSAAVAAEMWDYRTALEVVIDNARLTVEHCPQGKMIAIMDSIDIINNSDILKKYSTLVGVNFSNHFVISVMNENLTEIEQYLQKFGIIHQILPIKYAFHSKSIDSLKEIFEYYIYSIFPLNPPKIKFISSMAAKELETINLEDFWNIVRKPIEFQNALTYLEELGNGIYVDCGPSGTMATFVKYNLSTDSSSLSFPIATPFNKGLENMNDLKKELSISQDHLTREILVNR